MNNVINSFPGYRFAYDSSDNRYHNVYRETDVGFGGYIISNPGIYTNVALLDVASLHPNSIRAMNCFGDYTKNFTDILDARIAIKHKDFDSARKMLDGRLIPYLKDESTAKDLAQALKIAVNSVYGLTAASFNNPFRDERNKNNIVALRGALFMRTLQDEVEQRGFKIVAIKTDSIKIADATREIVEFCMAFAKRYSYTFEHEASYSKMCQINDADYVANYMGEKTCMDIYGYVPGDNEKHAGEWTATGAQFQVPYVFKTLFSKEPIEFADMCETKSVTTALHLDLNEKLPSVVEYETALNLRRDGKPYDNHTKKERSIIDLYSKFPDEELEELISKGHSYQFIGKVGQFCPIIEGAGGGILCRESKDKNGYLKYSAATGSKGYRWLESEMVRELGKEDDIDRSYYNKLVDDAVDAISKYGDFEQFVSDDIEPEEEPLFLEDLPWKRPCGKDSCIGCVHFSGNLKNLKCDEGYDISDLITINDDFIKR